MKIFLMAVRMRGARRRVKGWYSRKGGEVVDLSLDINRLRCYLMKTFLMAVRM
jgi:hypothetical protein